MRNLKGPQRNKNCNHVAKLVSHGDVEQYTGSSGSEMESRPDLDNYSVTVPVSFLLELSIFSALLVTKTGV